MSRNYQQSPAFAREVEEDSERDERLAEIRARRLCEAAPDMLAALRIVAKECRFANLAEDGSQKPNTPAARVLKICGDAIAKAEGRS